MFVYHTSYFKAYILNPRLCYAGVLVYLGRGSFGAGLGCVSTLQVQTVEETHLRYYNVHDVCMCITVLCYAVCIAQLCGHQCHSP